MQRIVDCVMNLLSQNLFALFSEYSGLHRIYILLLEFITIAEFLSDIQPIEF